MKEHNRNNKQNHDTRYNVVHPQCRGYVHRTVFYSTFYKNHNSDLHTQLQISSSPQSRAHSCKPLCTQLQISLITQKPCAHTAAEVIHAHSWDFNLFLPNTLSFASIHLTSKS